MKSRNYEDNLIKCELADYRYCHNILGKDPQTTAQKLERIYYGITHYKNNK